MRRGIPRVLLLACLALGCSSLGGDGFPQGRIVDLTWAFDGSTLYWPTEAEGFEMKFGPEGYTEQGYWYAANRFRAPEHGGTHLDAPIHFHEDRWRVDEALTIESWVIESKRRGAGTCIAVTNASVISRAEANCLDGSRWSARTNQASIPDDKSGRNKLTGVGSGSARARHSLPMVSPSKGNCPVSATYATTPSAHKSV